MSRPRPRPHPHRNQRLTAPLPLKAQEPPHPRLPRGCFGALTGVFDRAALISRYRTVPDDNHVYLWLRVSYGLYTGCYECAVNVASPAGDQLAPALFHEREEPIPATDLPPEGFSMEARCSYAGLGLQETDFTEVPHLTLGPMLIAYAQASVRIAAYGVAYENGEGLHDLHLNSHELPHSGHRDRLDATGQPTQDGALIFYLPWETGNPALVRAHWVFLKFRSQRLPGSTAPLAALSIEPSAPGDGGSPLQDSPLLSPGSKPVSPYRWSGHRRSRY